MNYHLLAVITLSVCSTVVVCRNDVVRWIESPRKTYYGNWGSVQYCPDNTWVQGVNVKIENNQGGKDDTALNGIELTCVSMTGGNWQTIKSSEGPWGYQRGYKYCPNGFMSGFELKSDPDQGGGDDAGAVDLRMLCADGISKPIAGDILPWGEWTGEQWCPQRSAVCGLQTQVEGSQGSGDDTALNNVHMGCCSIPHPADICKVSTVWKLVLACHAGITNCSRSITTGQVNVQEYFSSETWSRTTYERNGFDMSGSYGLGQMKLRASYSTEWGTETTTQKTRETLVSQTSWFQETFTFTLACVGRAEELYIVCGPYEISTKEIRCVPDVI